VPAQFLAPPEHHDWRWVALSLQNKGNLVSGRGDHVKMS
jgi:hypothetical protein